MDFRSCISTGKLKSDVSLFRFLGGFMTFHEVERCLYRHFAHVPGTQLKKSLDIFWSRLEREREMSEAYLVTPYWL